MENSDSTASPTAPEDDAPHLLVVDDDTRIRNLLKQYLSENGFRITVAGNADEARLSTVSQRKPDFHKKIARLLQPPAPQPFPTTVISPTPLPPISRKAA